MLFQAAALSCENCGSGGPPRRQFATVPNCRLSLCNRFGCVDFGGVAMAERSGVFLLQGVDSLLAMEPAQFAKEEDFQRLVSRFPELLVGDQINPESPRRWLLVRREQPISTGEIGASQ